jgi:UDP-2,4-diacetamido-2,4,6-trideoxy-beta-L-altropyranose hydrolase
VPKVNYRLRKVINEDIDLLFAWVNDKEVRNNSINTNPILLDEHQKWFKSKMDSSNTSQYILEVNNVPAGQMRFDYDESERAWIIDYSIAAEHRGLGLGKILVQLGLETFGECPVVAYVKSENERSKKVFESLGFVNEGVCKTTFPSLLRFIKSC